jgi:hypothetical protein
LAGTGLQRTGWKKYRTYRKTGNGNGVIVLWRFDHSDLPHTHSTQYTRGKLNGGPGFLDALGRRGCGIGVPVPCRYHAFGRDPAPHSKRPRNPGCETLGVPSRFANPAVEGSLAAKARMVCGGTTNRVSQSQRGETSVLSGLETCLCRLSFMPAPVDRFKAPIDG